MAIVVVVVALRAWSTNVYAITPGNATNVAPLVTVAGLGTDPHRDRIMLVDVYLQPLSELQYLLMHLQSHVEFVSADQLLEPGIPNSQLVAQGYLQMSDSQMAAKVAALRALGWKIPVTPTGAVITGVVSNTPASRAGLSVGDEITGINGEPVTSQCSLVGALAHVAVGTKLELTVRPGQFSPTGVLTRTSAIRVAVTTARSPNVAAPTGCPQAPRAGASWLGVAPEDGVTYSLPGRITLDTANIGGPSAGLAMTLTLIDALSRGSMTGGHVIATTGTIDPQGNVGEVGGVAEKTIAVENAGVHYFFVPRGEVATARSAANASLHIYGVTRLSQVLAELRKLGGAALVPFTAPR
ncbi:MAG: PDZ domain-containing protein [Acidobacteria bacterium]|nr:PDZ domain-containing protein [Acidobacteriota bacterium]